MTKKKAKRIPAIKQLDNLLKYLRLKYLNEIPEVSDQIYDLLDEAKSLWLQQIARTK